MSQSILRLNLSMAGTIAFIIGITTVGLGVVLAGMGTLSLTSLVTVVIAFNLIQWLFAPYLINFAYRVKKMATDENQDLQYSLEDMARRSGIKTPKLMISGLPIPNAFAYGSPMTGNHVAVTQGLLDTLDADEVKAVVAHEVGHIKNRDMQVMMIASFLPSMFYILARSFMWSGNRRSNGFRMVGGVALLIYFLLTIANLSLSRIREYYADRHGASLIPDGARKLSEALAKISHGTYRAKRDAPRNINVGSYKALFISDPDTAFQDTRDIYELKLGLPDSDLVSQITNRRLTGMEKFTELFSTHPNIVKRLRALRNL